MPTAAEKLTPKSSDEERQNAITASISQLMNEGTEQNQALAIAISQADTAMGRERKVKRVRDPVQDELASQQIGRVT